MRYPLLIAMTVVLLAGCQGPPSPHETDADQAPASADGSSAPSETAPRAPPAPETRQNLFLNDCMQTTALVELPRFLPGSPPPPPWGMDFPFMVANYDVFECTRFGWGSIERGPVTLVLESQIIVGPPSACVGGATESARHLRAVYTDDAEIGLALGSELFADYYNATITIKDHHLPAPGLKQIIIHPAGYEPSSFELRIDFEENGDREYGLVYLGLNGSVSSRILLEGSATHTQPNPLLALATLSEPTFPKIIHGVPTPGRAAFDVNLEIMGQVDSWDGPNCA